MLWEQGVAGSNPATPTKVKKARMKVLAFLTYKSPQKRSRVLGQQCE